jgi:hypothetical protein
MAEGLISLFGLKVGDRVEVYLNVGQNTYGRRVGTILDFMVEHRVRIRVELDEPANGRKTVLSEKRYVRKLSLLELIAIAASD